MDTYLQLECFDPADPATSKAREDFDAGYAAGLAAGHGAAKAEADHLNQAMAQSVAAIRYTYQQARQDIMSSLPRLMTDLAETVLPFCVRHGFAAQITDMILTRLHPGQGDTICLYVHPDQVNALTATTATLEGNIAVMPDPTLTPQSAWIRQAQEEIYLDMDQLLAEIAELLSNITASNQGHTDHG